MARVHVNIGSNLGDRHNNIERAVAMLRQLALVDSPNEGDAGFVVSSVVESAPWGFVSDNRFINVGVGFETAMEPHELLRRLLVIEKRVGSGAHRLSDGTYADRLIDLDLIFYGDVELKDSELELPHPRMHLRDFVLRSVAETDPQWRHPRFDLTASELLSELLAQQQSF